MKKIFIIIIFTIAYVSVANAETKNLKELGIKGYEMVYDMKFEEAEKIFDEMIRLEPENALGYLLKALSYGHLWKIHGFYPKLGNEYKDRLVKARNIANKMLDKNKDDLDALFYAGCTYGNLGLYYLSNDPMNAYTNGLKGRELMTKVIENDPSYYDAYIGLGLYHYYSEVLSKSSKAASTILGNTEGYKKRGNNELILALSKGKYVNDEVKNIIANDIYIQTEADHEAALPLLKELTTKYPHNLFLKNNLANCYRKLGNHDLAVQTLELSIVSLSRKKYPYLYWIQCTGLGQIYFELNEFDKSISAYKNALNIPIYESDTLYSIGNSYEMMGSINKAYEYYKKIKEKEGDIKYNMAKARLSNPLTPSQIKLTKGSNYLKSRKYTKADSMFTELLESEFTKNSLDKTFLIDLYFNIGITKYSLKKYEKSIQIFNKILASKDYEKEWVKTWSHYHLGNCYRDTGKIEKAIQEYNIAYKFANDELRHMIDKARSKIQSM